jgi:hypothetical protein
MSVSINDMRDFVSGGLDDIPGGDDFGNIINLGEIGDDLGANLLANTRVTPAQQSHSKSVSFDIGGSGSGSGIDILEPLESINLDINLDSGLSGGGSRQSSGPNIQINREDNFGIPSGTPAAPSWSFGGGAETIAAPSNAEAEKKEKADLINKLNRLESKGYPVSKRFTMDNTLDEIKTEFDRLVDARQLETSVKFQRQMMMGLVTGLEMMNEKVVPDRLKANIDGWSESVHENVEDFDEVFEELYDKYDILIPETEEYYYWFIPNDMIDLIDWVKDNCSLPFQIVRRTPYSSLIGREKTTWRREDAKKIIQSVKK